MPDEPSLDPTDKALDEPVGRDNALSAELLAGSIVALLQELQGLRHELSLVRSATGAAAHDTRVLLLGVSDLAEKAHGLLSAARRRGPQDGLPEPWLARIERLARATTGVAESAGLSLRVPAGHPQPGVDEVVDTVESDGVSSGEIVEVVRVGLLWRGEVLRRAEVVVAR